MAVAILVDGGFFLKRYIRVYPGAKNHSAKQVCKNFYTLMMKHVDGEDLYRIFFYDCTPFSKKAHNPVSGSAIDFSKTPQADFRAEFHQELIRRRKIALRLGYLQDGKGWVVRRHITKELLKKSITVDDVKDSDVYYDLKQKGVDIKIGLDIVGGAHLLVHVSC